MEATKVTYTVAPSGNEEESRVVSEQEARAVIDRNRARLVTLLRTLPEERHSPYFFFADNEGDASYKMEQGGMFCTNGAALLLAGVTNLDTIYDDPYRTVESFIAPCLGTTRRVIAEIDTMNRYKTFQGMADWLEYNITHHTMPEDDETIFEFSETLTLS